MGAFQTHTIPPFALLDESGEILWQLYRNMEAMSQRSLYIDYIKALGIILVILYHCQYVPFDSMLVHGIYAMCVPLFFMVNGYLMLRKEHSISALLKKNLKILIVMFAWALVSTAVYMWTNGEWSANNLIGGG